LGRAPSAINASKSVKCAAIGKVGDAHPLRRQEIDHPDKLDIRQACKHAGVIAAHDTRACPKM
jgi:hypothetical protein